MKYHLLPSTLFASLAFLSPLSEANAKPDKTKHWNIGAGTSALAIDWDGMKGDTFSGFALSTVYAFDDNFAIKGQYYQLNKKIRSGFDVSGVEATAYYGTGLATQGFKAYLGGGFYLENIDFYNLEDDIWGTQITGGIGYNWRNISLELSLNVRSTGDYEDFSGYNDVTTLSSSLILSYRF